MVSSEDEVRGLILDVQGTAHTALSQALCRVIRIHERASLLAVVPALRFYVYGIEPFHM